MRLLLVALGRVCVGLTIIVITGMFFFFFFWQLVLKHRQGKNHKMRIIVFVGSPVEADEKDVSCLDVMRNAVLLLVFICSV